MKWPEASDGALVALDVVMTAPARGTPCEEVTSPSSLNISRCPCSTHGILKSKRIVLPIASFMRCVQTSDVSERCTVAWFWHPGVVEPLLRRPVRMTREQSSDKTELIH